MASLTATRDISIRPRFRLSLPVWVGLVLAVALLMRVGLLSGQGLWADEFFSLAIATGHSLEQPADVSESAQGDFVESPGPTTSAAYSRYAQLENPPAGPGRILRAVRLSDTSPPLYYLLLGAWICVAGTSDLALHLFSLGWALACLPMMAAVARLVGGRRAVLPTCLLFALSPACVFYSTEGRMYSLVWFWAVSVMWLALELERRGFSPILFLLWVGCGAAGLLTHYFFAFVWAGVLLWLCLSGRLQRRVAAAGAILSGLLILPWYIHLPESLSAWRVTATWLSERPANYHGIVTFLYIPWIFFSIHGAWGVPLELDCLNVALFLVVTGAILWATRSRIVRLCFAPRRRLLWSCLFSVWFGLVVFDFLRGTYVLAVPRYALPALPAALLLAGLGLSRLPPKVRAVCLVVISGMWLIGDRHMLLNHSRCEEPFAQVGQYLAEHVGDSELVIVHSIPSGVVGVARSMEAYGAAPERVCFVSWVGQLRQRRVQDLERLVAGRRRVFLVRIHEVREPAPEEDWLRAHTTLVDEYQPETATIRSFVP